MTGFVRNMVRQAGQVRERRGPVVNVLAGTGNGTLTAEVLAGGIVAMTPTADRLATFDTAAHLLASQTFADMDIGDSYEFTVVNHAAVGSGFDITLTAATGVTEAGAAGNSEVLAATSRRVLLTKTSATTMTWRGL